MAYCLYCGYELKGRKRTCSNCGNIKGLVLQRDDEEEIPTREEIRAACLEIQKHWSPGERRARMVYRIEWLEPRRTKPIFSNPRKRYFI